MRTWKPVVGTGNIGSPDHHQIILENSKCTAELYNMELDHWALFGNMKKGSLDFGQYWCRAEWMQGHEIWTQCGSLGAGRPFVVCNDQLLHF